MANLIFVPSPSLHIEPGKIDTFTFDLKNATNWKVKRIELADTVDCAIKAIEVPSRDYFHAGLEMQHSASACSEIGGDSLIVHVQNNGAETALVAVHIVLMRPAPPLQTPSPETTVRVLAQQIADALERHKNELSDELCREMMDIAFGDCCRECGSRQLPCYCTRDE